MLSLLKLNHNQQKTKHINKYAGHKTKSTNNAQNKGSNKSAPYRIDGRLFATDVSAMFKVT